MLKIKMRLEEELNAERELKCSCGNDSIVVVFNPPNGAQGLSLTVEKYCCQKGSDPLANSLRRRMSRLNRLDSRN